MGGEEEAEARAGAHRHHKRACNKFADGNASVAYFNYVHGTAFLPLPDPDPVSGETEPDRGGGGALGGSKEIYVCDEDNSRIRR
eukprot:COSAG01_NODE_4292_length_5167_cov_2.551500_3_plen_84_part_00